MSQKFSQDGKEEVQLSDAINIAYVKAYAELARKYDKIKEDLLRKFAQDLGTEYKTPEKSSVDEFYKDTEVSRFSIRGNRIFLQLRMNRNPAKNSWE